jgi:hypothetical protein
MHLIFPSFMIWMAFATAAEAHQPYESSTRVLFDRDRMEVCVTTSVEMAMKLMGGATLNASTVESLRPQLRSTGAELYEVASNGKPVEAERVFFSLKNEDALFSVIYPLARGVEMTFNAAYLEKLPNGYSGSISVFNEAPDELPGAPELLIGHKSLMTKDPSRIKFSLHVPGGSLNPENEQEKAPLLKEPAMPVDPVRKDTGPPSYPRAMLVGGIGGMPVLMVAAWGFFHWNRKSKVRHITC